MVYITSENTPESLSTKMESIGRNVSTYLKAGAFQIFPLESSSHDPHPDLSMEYLVQGVEQLPSQHEVILMDSITDVAVDSQDKTIINFFSRCKRLCSDGRTVILTLHPDIFEDRLLTRIRAVCDAHFSLTSEKQGNKLVKTLEVQKVHGAELITDNVFNFEVVPGIGMRAYLTTTIRV